VYELKGSYQRSLAMKKYDYSYGFYLEGGPPHIVSWVKWVKNIYFFFIKSIELVLYIKKELVLMDKD
jgi:hypothetical protein